MIHMKWSNRKKNIGLCPNPLFTKHVKSLLAFAICLAVEDSSPAQLVWQGRRTDNDWMGSWQAFDSQTKYLLFFIVSEWLINWYQDLRRNWTNVKNIQIYEWMMPY